MADIYDLIAREKLDGQAGRELEVPAPLGLAPRRTGTERTPFALAPTPFAPRPLGASPAPALPTDEEAPQGDVYSRVAETMLRDAEAMRQQRLKAAVEQNPDQAAEASKFAERYKVPFDAAYRNLDELKKREAAEQAGNVLADAPKLRAFLDANPDMLPQVQDEIEPMSTLERLLSPVAAGARFIASGAPLLSAGGYATVEAVLKSVAVPIGDVFSGQSRTVPGIRLLPANPFRAIAETIEAVRKGQQALVEDVAGPMPEDPGWLYRGVRGGLQSAGANLPAYVLTALTRNPVYALSSAGITAGGNAAAEALDQGQDPTRALLYGAMDASIEVAMEKIPLLRLVSDLEKGTGFARLLGAQLLREIPTEQATTVLQDANAWATLNPSKTAGEFLRERPDAAVVTLVATIVGTSVQTSGAYGVQRAAQALENRQRMAANEQRLAQMMQQAGALASRERNPEGFRQAMQAMALQADGTEQMVYVDGGVLAQLPLEAIQQLPEDVWNQITPAAESGDRVAIPVSAALTYAPGTPLEQAIQEYGVLNPFDDSPAEIAAQDEQAQVFAQQEQERIVAQAENQEKARAEADLVRETLAAELTATGRYRPKVADAMATWASSFYTSMGARTGMTPTQFMQRYRLRVLGAAPTAQSQVLNAPRPGRVDGLEAFHYSPQDLNAVTTATFGTGLQGSNRDLYLNAEDKRLRQRAYFYVDKGTGVTPEVGVGGRAHRALLDNVYDADADPLRLKAGRDVLGFESAVLDAGFSGYLSRQEGTQPGQVVLLGNQAVPVEGLGALGRTTGRVVPPPVARGARDRDVVGDAIRRRADLPAGALSPQRWGQILERLAPAEHAAMRDAGVFEGDGAVYRDELLRRFESLTPAPVYEQRAEGDTRFRNLAIDTLAEITPPRRSAVGILRGEVKFPVFRTLFEIGRWFNAKNRDYMDDMENPTVRKRLLDALYADTLMALTDTGSAVGWYDAKVKAALSIMAEVHPEIATNDRAKFEFLTILALTSNQTLVNENFELADALYTKWKDTGEWPVDVGAVRDTRAKTEMSKSMVKMKALIDTHGWEAVRDFMTTKLPAREIEKFTGYKITGENAESAVYGAVFLGPKLGAFFNNLYGNFDPVTMDRWFMRTINRLRGSMLETPGNMGELLTDLRFNLVNEGQLFGQDLNAMLAELDAYEALTPGEKADVLVVLETQPTVRKHVKARHAAFAKPVEVDGKKHSYYNRTSENQLAKTLNNAFHLDSQTPRNGADRVFLRGLVYSLQQKLKSNGIDMVVADIQAALWYYEKDLVAKLKGEGQQTELFEDETDEAQDYETAARRVLAARRGQPDGGVGRPAARVRDRARKAADARADTTRDLFAQRDPAERLTRGTFINVGLSTAEVLGGGTLTTDEVRRALAGLGVQVVDLNTHTSNTEPTAVVELDRPLTQAEGDALSATLRQEAVSQLSDGNGDMFGPQAVNWGPYNPDLFLMPDGRTQKETQDGTRNGTGGGTAGGLAPLSGSPVIVGASGPDPRIVAVAERYAAENGIPLTRQGKYVQVDPARAARIAAAYDAMPHAPQDPAVQAAYADMIRQTQAQYDALVAAGYSFTFFDSSSDPYAGNPWNAMRDLRANQTMAVYGTYDGYGTEGVTQGAVEGNPMLADTGLQWPDQAGAMRQVTANDLFRAVHDAFGHGMEGAGFRAQGEENAWQAHVRMFTGPAVGAITSETRGQNSWLNYGPYGEANQKAKVEDTVFADQKTGLMPEWTWTEGRVADAAPAAQETLDQGPRGTFNPRTLEVVLNPNANLTTWFHETGHFFLEVMSDIASQPDAPAQITNDMAAVLKWFGVADLATWNAMPLDQQRQYHERWAESVEQYVIEGKAPSKELAPLMRKFSAWLKDVYKSIQALLKSRGSEESPIQLNDDIRRIMDRMLATDEQIAEAEQIAGLTPNAEDTDVAAERLRKRSMGDLKWAVRARDAVIKKLQAQAKVLRKEAIEQATQEVDAMPEMRAARALEALTVDVEHQDRLNAWNKARSDVEAKAKEEVQAQYLAAEEAKTGVELKALAKGQFLSRVRREIAAQVELQMIQWDRANRKPLRQANPNDVEMATIADSFGFPSVEAMVQAIEDFGTRRDAIDTIAEQRMLEEHGDLVDDRAIQQAANEAVHNEARARSLATELRTQAEMLNERQDTGRVSTAGSRITTSVLVGAAKAFAANIVARTPLRSINATAWSHTAAERRAARRWAQATAKGDTAVAVKAKQDQLLHHTAAAALLDAQAEGKKIRAFFARVVKGKDEKVVEKGRDPDIVNAARAVLAAYGIETPASKGAQAYLKALQEHDPETHNAIAPMIAEAVENAQPIDALTFAELENLHESIQAMWHLAKQSRLMEVAGNLMDIDDAADEIYLKLEEIGIPVNVPGEAGALTKKEERGRMLQYAGALLRRVEQWAEAKDGKYGGPFLRIIFQPIKDAATRYRAERLDYRREFKALIDKVAPSFKPGEIAAPELGYTFGRGHNGGGYAELLHAVLHTGNASNKRKLLLGRKWATQNPDGTMDTTKWDLFIARLHRDGVLRREHYNFVQGVWDLLEKTKAGAQKAHRDVYGRYFAEVTADSFDTPFGTFRGGYVPAQADARLVPEAEQRELIEAENANMAFAFPGTAKGFTQSRVEYNRPLVLDLRTLPQHIDKVLLFSHMEIPVRAAARLLRRPKVQQPLNLVDPAAISGMLRPWLNRSARQIVETPIVGDGRISRILSVVRARAGMALMFANVSNTIQQLTGFSNLLTKVKPRLVRTATAQYLKNPKQFTEAVHGLSLYMAERGSQEVAAMNGQVEALLLDPSLMERAQDWTMRHAYFMQIAVDNVLSPIAWNGAYNQALEQGVGQDDAVRFADGVVRQTQTSTLPEDISRIESGPAYARVFTQFFNYFSMLYNTNTTAVQQVVRESGVRKGAGRIAFIVTAGLLVPLWTAEAIAVAMRGGPEDVDDDGYLDDWIIAVIGMGTAKGLLAGVPILGQFAVAGINRLNNNPADDRVSMAPVVSLLEAGVGAPVSVYRALADEGSTRKAVRDLASLLSLLTGLPFIALARPLGYAAGVANEEIEPTSRADAVRGLVSGAASPESR